MNPLPALNDRFKVNVCPDPTTIVPVPFTVQRLFDNVPSDPGVSGPSHPVPSSFCR